MRRLLSREVAVCGQVAGCEVRVGLLLGAAVVLEVGVNSRVCPPGPQAARSTRSAKPTGNTRQREQGWGENIEHFLSHRRCITAWQTSARLRRRCESTERFCFSVPHVPETGLNSC